MSEHTALPTEGDLSTFLDGLGLDLDLDALASLYPNAVRSAADEFQRRTSRVLLAVAGTRSFDPPTNRNGFLSFGADLASLTSVTVGGVAYTEGADFRLWRPDGGPADGPWWGLRFRRRWSGPLSFAEEQSVEVTGAWGFGTTVPDWVFQALLEKAASHVWGQVQLRATGGLRSVKEGDVSFDFGGDTWASLNAQWSSRDSSFELAIATYLRVEY